MMSGHGPPAGGFGRPGGPPPIDPRDRPRGCACGAPAPRVDEGPASLGMMRVGTKSTYRCARCGRSFAVRSLGHVAVALLYGVFMTAVGVLFVVYPPGAAVGADKENRLFAIPLLLVALACLGWSGAMIRARVVHPEV